MRKRILTIMAIVLGLCLAIAFFDNGRHNDLRDLFLSNNSIILTINIRNFNAKDTNGNSIIDEDEERGNFLNAIDRLDEIKELGINTLHIMPIMEVGTVRAIGTAGSLYAAKSFNKLNPQLKDEKSDLPLEEQAKKFIQEAHKRGLYVIIDLPGCAAYELSLSRPELFVKDSSGKVASPYNMKDVRPLDGGSEIKINKETYYLYKSFVDYVIYLGADGIRADAASTKPSIFWKKLIDYSKTRDSQFLWLAEAYTTDGGIAREVKITPYFELLEAGFDGYYDGFPSIIEWEKASNLIDNIKFTIDIQKKCHASKRVVGSFTTHDEKSPVLIKGIQYSRMILWLNSTLKLNPLYVDGFQTGDDYYRKARNKHSDKTLTDDYTYFINPGKIDVFNFTQKPEGKYSDFKDEFKYANNFRQSIAPIITYGGYKALKTSNIYVYAYGISYNGTTVLTFGNINFKKGNKTFVEIPGLTPETKMTQIKSDSKINVKRDGFDVTLSPGEIQVYLINNYEL